MNLTNKINELGFHSLEDYHLEAFQRNIGFITQAELTTLRHKRVAIPGLGGVGGLHLITHLRTGFCYFNIADFDVFEVANSNRQYGAKVSHFKKSKLESMLEEAKEINPFAQFNTFPHGVNEQNIDLFLDGVDILIDSLDAFVIDLRILLLKKAREKGIPVVAAGPLGFGTSVLAFSPTKGMSAEAYYGIKDNMDTQEKFVRFVSGAAPKSFHAGYLDILSCQPHIKKAPSLGAGCLLAASVACATSVKILLGKKGVRYAPAYFAVDPYSQKVSKGTLYGGNNNPLQILKMRMVRKVLDYVALKKDQPPEMPVYNTSSSTIPYVVKEYLVRAGTQAPSGDNTQPWRFEIGKDDIIIKLDSQADRSFFNIQNRASLIAIGAAIENIKIAASAFQLSCTIQSITNEPLDNDEIAKIYLRQTGIKKDALFRSIYERCTNRKQYSRRAIEPYVWDELTKVMEEIPSVKLHIIKERDALKKLQSALIKIGIVRTKNKDVHKFLFDHIRYTFKEAAQNRTGFSLDNLELGKVGNIALKAIKDWKVMNFLNKIGFAKILAKKVDEGIINCGACIMITVPSNSASDYIQGGRALERIWLKLTELGVSVQPETTMNFYNLIRQMKGLEYLEPEQHALVKKSMEEFKNLFPGLDMDKHGQIMLMRIGYSKGIKTWTLRQNVKTIIDPMKLPASQKKHSETNSFVTTVVTDAQSLRAYPLKDRR